jgi:transposase
MNQMTMTFQRQITRKHIPNRKAIRCINALTKEGLSDINIAEMTGITRQSVLAIRNGGDVRRSTYAKLMKAKLSTKTKKDLQTSQVASAVQRKEATIAALDLLNRAGWTDEKISATIYSRRSHKRGYINHVRGGRLMTVKVFARLVSLAERVCNGSPQVNQAGFQSKATAQVDSKPKKKPSKIIDGQRFYSVKDISELIGVHGHTVRKYIKTGELQARRIGYGFWVSEGNLNLWLAYLRGRADKPNTADRNETTTISVNDTLWQRFKQWIASFYAPVN